MKDGGHLARKRTMTQLYNIINGIPNYKEGRLIILEPIKEVAAREISRRKNALKRDIDRFN